MKQYSDKIALVRNRRGVYCLDTTMGCGSWLESDPRGCYGDCYAARSARAYGYDFSKTVLRRFENRAHERRVIAQINRARLDFVRIGCSGDPSEDWPHTVSILRVIANCNKEIVLITKHWTALTDEQLEFFSTLNICVNTSVSALDKPELLANSLFQYSRLRPFCRSVLRIVSAEFNLENEHGIRCNEIQKALFQNGQVIDTVLRVGENNPIVTQGIVKIKKGIFMGKKCYMSKHDKKTFTGKCDKCREMCGITINNDGYAYKRTLSKQLQLFIGKL